MSLLRQVYIIHVHNTQYTCMTSEYIKYNDSKGMKILIITV